MILWEKICGQTAHKNILGKFGECRAKIFRTHPNILAPKNFSAPMPMVPLLEPVVAKHAQEICLFFVTNFVTARTYKKTHTSKPLVHYLHFGSNY